MTTPTPADAVRAAIDALRHATDEEIAAVAIRAAADAILPRPAVGDRSPQASGRLWERLQFLSLCDELAGNPVPVASQEALADAREESQAAAIEPSAAEEAHANAPVAADRIQPGPYSENDLRQMWNALGNEPWSDLDHWEHLAFAQTQAIEADRRRRAEPAPAAPALPPALVAEAAWAALLVYRAAEEVQG